MVEGEMVHIPAELAGKPVAQEQVEAGEGGKFAWAHILLQRDHAGDLHVEIGGMDLAVVGGDDVHPVEEDGLDRGLPWPEAERVIGKRGVIGVQDE